MGKGIDYKWQVLIVVAIGAFMGTMDLSMLNVALPRLTVVFKTDLSLVVWVAIAYTLVSTGLMLTAGRLGDLIGRKKVFVLGLAIFTVGLILCAVSQSIIQLILARAVQGIGSAMIVAIGMAIVTAAFPARERGKAMGIAMSVVSSGMLVGPVLSGFLLDTLDWRAIFYVQIPIGIIGVVLGWILLKEQKAAGGKVKFDLWGSAALFAGLACLLLFFNLGGKSGFLSVPVLILAGSTLVLAVLFIMLERKTAQPVIDMGLFKNHIFTSGNLSIIILSLSTSAMLILMPFYMINGIGYSASKAGLFFALTSVLSIAIAPVSGWLSDKVGSRLLCSVGLGLVCAGLLLFSTVGTNPSYLDLFLRFFMIGIGMGMFSSPNTSSVMGSVPKEKLGTASAMISTIRQIGYASGVAITGAIFTSRELFHAAQLAADNLDPLVLQKLSLIGSFKDSILIAGIVCVFGIVFSLIRGKKPAAPAQ